MPDSRESESYMRHLYEHPELIEDDLRLIRSLAPGQRILDIGAGRGSFVIEARKSGYEAMALDMQLDAHRLWQPAGVPGVVADGSRTPFRESSFDLVRMKEVIEHVEEPLRLVKEARRLLKPGGIILAHVPTPYSQFYPVGNFWDDYTHVRPLSRTGLQRLFSDAGLTVIRTDGYTAGRNALESALGKLLARVLPHIYRVTARR